MKWENLSLSEKSRLMKVYLEGGILSLSKMRKHFNSLADGGGEIDTPERIDGKVNFEGITTTKNRPYNPRLISYMNDKLSEFLDRKQRASLLGDIIEESGGNPFAMSKDSTYQGVIQWAKDRYRVPDYGHTPTTQDTVTELNKQIELLKSTLRNTTDRKSWTHGGKGSRFNTARHAFDTFWSNDLPLDSIHRALSFGHIRPAGGEHSFLNRQPVVNQVYNRIE